MNLGGALPSVSAIGPGPRNEIKHLQPSSLSLIWDPVGSHGGYSGLAAANDIILIPYLVKLSDSSQPYHHEWHLSNSSRTSALSLPG
jgi:hypothetical protein